jgi:manganese oxidase
VTVWSELRRAAWRAVPLTYGIGLWLVVLHHAEGAHEEGEPPLVVHALRDSTLALPAIVLAVWAATRFAERVLRTDPGASPSRRAAVVDTAVAVAASAAMAAGSPLHERLFAAHETNELPLALHVSRDALLALAVALPLTRILATFRRRRPLAVAVVVAAVVASTGSAVNAAALGPGNPCPAGAPLKQFDVQAIDVDITLNRFGDHDPAGKMYALSARLPDVRAQEASHQVSTGLGNDAIQPLVIRANEGDCVEVAFTNNASGGPFGIHIDGLSFDVGSSGDAVGANPDTAAAQGTTTLYRYFVPNDPRLEGAHYLRPGPGNRGAVSHGLFGVLAVEPPGSTYLDPATGGAQPSGWQAIIVPGTGRPSFREFVQIYHEVGNESDVIRDKSGGALPQTDPLTTSYRPGARAIDYRSEPFMNRLQANHNEKALGYGSYTFGDPATPIPRSYLGEPTKFRLVHGGGEMFHVHHLHGGGDRWRANPLADPTQNYGATGLDKHPKTQLAPSTRLDSQALGPGESYNLEIEGGAGGVQQAAGDFLWHCHIVEHYVSGMWSFWRVYDTRQPNLVPLPDRAAPPQAVDSAGLIGRTMPNGTVITNDNLDDWIRPQLPPQGVRKGIEDASVWDWTIDRSNPSGPTYLGEPEDTRPWPDLPNVVPGHPGSFPGDQYVGDRPKILFDPVNGRPAWPLLRPHIGFRPPFSPRGHTGAPWLGENGGAAPTSTVDPYAGRADGLCPSGAPVRRFNVVSIERPIQITKKGAVDPTGMIYVLAHDKAAVLNGSKPAQPLAIRSNAGDCDAITLTNELTDTNAFGGFSKVNMHIHHVQFDPQASDGVITGLSYEQSVRPYKVEDPQLAASAAAGATRLQLTSVAKFQPGVWIGVGLGTEAIDVRQIAAIDPATSSVTLTAALAKAHAAGEWAGVEFVQYRWFPDVVLDNVFWHDHVDGIHNWGHGLVGQLVVEPAGSTYHDPKTGAEVDSGTIVDIHTTNPLAPGVVDGSFREFAAWDIDTNPATDSTINLRAEPLNDRGGDPSLFFSSYTHGDPFTPLPRAYPGDPFVIRLISVAENVDAFHVDGHRFWLENRYGLSGPGDAQATPLDTVPNGISERFTAILQGGAGGPQRQPGDYLYFNGTGRRLRQGAWGLIRVLDGQVPDLKPLPGTTPSAAAATTPTQTGGRPPEPSGPGNPCPSTAPQHTFAVTALDVPTNLFPNGVVRELFMPTLVPTSMTAAVKAGTVKPDGPLVLHAAAGECVVVQFTNERPVRASLHFGELLRTPASSGVDAGFSPESTVAPNGTRTYRLYADSPKIESALIADFGEFDQSSIKGLYGAVVVAPAGATFTNPETGTPTDFGQKVDVHVPGTTGYRDFTVLLSDQDPAIGQSTMPYPIDVQGPALVDYFQAGPRPDSPNAFSSAANGGDPPTPILRAYAGDPVRVHALVPPASEQQHVFSLGGFSFPWDPVIPNSEELDARIVVPWGTVDAHVAGGAGGRNSAVGDFFYGDLRRPFTVAGLWGLQRVLPAAGSGCPIKPLDGKTCTP